MSKKAIITPEMAISRLSECREIVNLSADFRLRGATSNTESEERPSPFTIFISPKGTTNDMVAVIQAEPLAGEGFREIPVVLNCWNEYLLKAIKAGGIDLTKYRVWWGTGGSASPAEPPVPPVPPGKKLTDLVVGDVVTGQTVNYNGNGLPLPIIDSEGEIAIIFFNGTRQIILTYAGYTAGGGVAVLMLQDSATPDTPSYPYIKGHPEIPDGWHEDSLTIPSDGEWTVQDIEKLEELVSTPTSWGFDLATITE